MLFIIRTILAEAFKLNKNMRQFGVALEILKPFSWAMMKNMAIILICHSSYKSKQFLTPGGLSAECVQVSVM